jgi:hypothetical protein
MNGKLIPDQMIDLDMINIRFWKRYATYYGDSFDMGKYLMETQEECFKHENDGIELNQDMGALVTGPVHAPLPRPILSKNTTQDDLLEMEYVLHLEARPLQKFGDYTNTKQDDLNVDTKPSASSQLAINSLPTTVKRYKDSLEQSVVLETNFHVEETYTFGGDIVKTIKLIAGNERADKDIMTKFMTKGTNVYEEILNEMRLKPPVETVG